MSIHYVKMARNETDALSSVPDLPLGQMARGHTGVYIVNAANQADALKLAEGYRIGYEWAVEEAINGNIRIA